MFRSTAARPARLVISASIAAAALLLTGCSGGDSGKVEVAEGPLSKYLTALYGSEDYTQEKYDKEQLEIEELVAECMTKEGFEYTPNTSNGGVIFGDEDDQDGPDWGSEDFVKEYGYGIVNWPGMTTGDAEDSEEDEYVDLNEDYVQSLSESEQAAYYEALNGPGLSEEELEALSDEGADSSYEYNWETAGCYGAAQHNSSAGDGMQEAYEDPEFTELFASMETVWSSVYDEEQLNDDIAKLNRAWADCMSEAGYGEFSTPSTVQNALYEEYDALTPIDDETGEIKEPGKAEKQEFQEREITIALADFECKKSVSYEDEMMRVQNDLEQEFVDAHKAELDAMLAKYATTTSKN